MKVMAILLLTGSFAQSCDSSKFLRRGKKAAENITARCATQPFSLPPRSKSNSPIDQLKEDDKRTTNGLFITAENRQQPAKGRTTSFGSRKNPKLSTLTALEWLKQQR